MKQKIPGKYTTQAILFLAISAVLFAIALLSNPGNITTVAFVISGMVCAMTGIFALTFSWGEPIDPHMVGILPAQGSINFSIISRNNGIKGNAYFLPPRVTGEARVMQFNPTSKYDGKQGSGAGSFREKGPAGLVTFPSCDLLIQDLWKSHAMVIPDKEEGLSWFLGETIEDVFRFAPRVSVRWGGNKASVTFHNYPYIDGCKVIAQKSSQCCTMSPCPACSLCGAFISEGKDKVVTLERCSVSSSSKDVTAVFLIVP